MNDLELLLENGAKVVSIERHQSAADPSLVWDDVTLEVPLNIKEAWNVIEYFGLSTAPHHSELQATPPREPSSL